jgi:hypothetical protein
MMRRSQSGIGCAQALGMVFSWGPTPAPDQAYVDAVRPVVETQFEKAGIRLANLLNQLLR